MDRRLHACRLKRACGMDDKINIDYASAGKSATAFELFNELGIIDQLARTLFQARLPEGFSVSHFLVLNHFIRVEDGQTPLVLARAFQVPKTTMTHTLSVLKKHQLVKLKPNPKDRRSKCVWLTGKGWKFCEKANQRLAGELELLTKKVSPDFIADLVPKLTRNRAYMVERRDTD